MTIHTRRVLLSGLALVGLTAVSLTAQTVQKSPVPPTPSPVEQRYERVPRPPVRVRVGGLEVDDLQTFRSYRPILRVGQPYVLKAGDTAYDVRGVLANVRIEGHVEGDVVVVLGDVTLTESAVIDGALVVVGGSVTAASGAKVGRDFVLVGGNLEAPLDFEPQGQHVIIGTPAAGEALRAFVPWLTRGLLWGRVIVPDLRWVWMFVGIIFAVGLILNLLFNRTVAACADAVTTRPLTSFLLGLLMLALLPVLSVILAATVVGIAVVPFAIAAFIVAVIIGRISVVRALGRGVLKESDAVSGLQATRSYVVGSVLIVVAYMVPILGLIAWALVGSIGLGAATMTFFAATRRERPAAPPRPATPVGPIAAGSSAAPVSAFASVEPPSQTSAPPASYAAPDFDASATPASVAAAAPAAAPPASASAGGRDLTLYPRASFLDRVAALALDLVLVGIAAAFLGFGRYRGPGPFFTLLFVYHVAFWAWKGTTLGGIICSVRVVRTNNAALRFVDALVRGLSGIFSIVALGIGYFWMLTDAERQTWHDKIAGTVVVKLPRELVLD